MDPSRLHLWLAAPMASLFLVLSLCACVLQRSNSTGIRIPMMKARAVPLNNCEFNGFTVFLRSDGKLGGGSRDLEVQPGGLASQIAEARENIADQTIYIIADPDVTYGQMVGLLARIHEAAPPDHLAVVVREAQVVLRPTSGEPEEIFADRCQFEWPATANQPSWPADKPFELPRISVWKAITHQKP